MVKKKVINQRRDMEEFVEINNRQYVAFCRLNYQVRLFNNRDLIKLYVSNRYHMSQKIFN